MYHCHVEATEHMQMGMLGNLYVTPLQNDLPNGTPLNLNGSTFVHATGNKYVYNDGDGSTYYDVEFPIQMVAFDSNFHDQHIAIQPLPFAMMKDDYPMLNGRGYPDTVNPAALPAPAENGGKVSQNISARITATAGQKILLRISSLATVDFFTLQSLGIPMKVVGRDARILRSATGQNLHYTTNSITLGGGESADVILDTTGIAPGTYFLYATDLYHLNNGPEDFGGMMTEIVIS
jgi:FtsP/CotA-like multicopper oxidase with cupredoxin domain